jgi:hypothetical protein
MASGREVASVQHGSLAVADDALDGHAVMDDQHILVVGSRVDAHDAVAPCPINGFLNALARAYFYDAGGRW